MDFASIWLILKAKKPIYLTMILTTVRILEPVTICETVTAANPGNIYTISTIYVDKSTGRAIRVQKQRP